MAATRFAIALMISVAVTLSLLFVMQILIATGKDAITENTVGRLLEFVRVPRQETTEVKERKPEKPPQPQEQPPDMPEPQMDDINPNAEAINIAPVAVNADIDVGLGFGGSFSDGDYLPIVKVAPIYPRRAQTRGIEGYVIVEYTVTKQGTVKDVVVIEADPPNIFDRAAMQSALKYKYKPRVIEGDAVEVPGVQTIIRFELED